jgi:hypothetical protein
MTVFKSISYYIAPTCHLQGALLRSLRHAVFVVLLKQASHSIIKVVKT